MSRRLTELLGIELPIIQAPMAGVQGSALAAAVSNAGGLGSRRESRRAVLTNLFTGRPARSIVNRIMRELGPVSEVPPAFPLAFAAVAPLRAAAESRGRDDVSPLWCGQNASGCKEVPAASLTRELAAPALAALR